MGKRRLFSFGLLAMVATHALIHAAGNMKNTMIVELRDEFVLSNLEIGVIGAVPPLAQVLFSLPVGWMSDRYGARRLVALSIVMAALGALIAGFTVNPAMYIVALTLMTLTSTFYHPPSHSYTARLVEGEDRSKAMGFLNAGGTFGVALGPLSITVLMGYLAFQWRQVYLFWVAPIALSLVLVFFLRDMQGAGRDEANGEPVEGEVTTLLNRDFIMYLSASGVRQFALGMIGTFLSIYLADARGWSITELGIMFGASSFLGLAASPIGGYMASRLGDKRWVVIALGISYLFYIGAFLTEGVLPFMALYLAYRFFGILGMPATASLTAKLSPPRQMGMGFAVSFLPQSIVGVVAPIVAAYIADIFGLFPIFTASFIIMFLGLGVLHFGVKVD
ncbi:MAG: MFS transporter [Candidatus Bathyarchaeota archaeon]